MPSVTLGAGRVVRAKTPTNGRDAASQGRSASRRLRGALRGWLPQPGDGIAHVDLQLNFILVIGDGELLGHEFALCKGPRR